MGKVIGTAYRTPTTLLQHSGYNIDKVHGYIPVLVVICLTPVVNTRWLQLYATQLQEQAVATRNSDHLPNIITFVSYS